jgi:hypothetical protein
MFFFIDLNLKHHNIVIYIKYQVFFSTLKQCHQNIQSGAHIALIFMIRVEHIQSSYMESNNDTKTAANKEIS